MPGVAASVSTGLFCCGGFPLAICLPSAQHICSAHLCSQLPQLELGTPRPRSSCAGCVQCPSSQGPQSPGGQLCRRQQGVSLVGCYLPWQTRDPACRSILLGPRQGTWWPPPPSFLHLNCLWSFGGHTHPQLCSLAGGPHPVLPSSEAPHQEGVPGCQPTRGHLHTGAALALGLAVAPE